MIDCYANTVDIWYANYVDSVDAVDENGDFTGEPYATYAEPIKIRANLSPARGMLKDDLFGANLDYSKSLTTSRMDHSIDERTIIWDEEPARNADGTVDFDSAKYRCVSVAKGRYHMRYALKQRKNEGD